MAIRSKSINKVIAFPSRISEHFNAEVVTNGNMPATIGTLPIYNENNEVIGYVPLYEEPDLGT